MDRAIRGLDIDAAVGERDHSLHYLAHGTFSPSRINEPFLYQILSRQHISCLVLVSINSLIENKNVNSLEEGTSNLDEFEGQTRCIRKVWYR